MIPQAVLKTIRAQAAAQRFRVTQHAQQRMAEEDITLDEVLQVLNRGTILESYPEHRRGPCCLIGGLASGNRPVHVVCTAGLRVLVVITVYEPRPPKWTTLAQRGREL